MIWVKQIDDPSAFGVVQLNEKNEIVDFVEKPKEFVSDLAMIGIYFFKDGKALGRELNFLVIMICKKEENFSCLTHLGD